jgi:putative ABC transport system permease protein
MRSSFLQALHSWKNAKSVALLAIAALAIGIGSTTAIFTVIQSVLLKPLPYANAERYYSYFGGWRSHPGWWTSVSYSDYLDIARQAQTVEVFGCSATGSVNVTFNHHPLHVTGTQLSASLAQSFGIQPLLGRWYNEADKEPAGLHAVVISAALWRRFGSDPNIVGKPLTMNGQQFTVTGVMPAWFRFPIRENDNDIWSPLNPDDNQKKFREYHYLRCEAKLKPGITRQQAEQDFNRIQGRLQRQYPAAAETEIATLTPDVEWATQDIRPGLLLLLGAAVALFLITCANVASLLLARSVARARETAVRVALGASNWQLGWHYFFEGALLSLAGACMGTLLSLALVRTVLAIAADQIPRSRQITTNWQVLGFALLLAIACGIFFSIWPLWQARHVAPNEVLSEGTRASAGTGSQKLLNTFVVTQVALTFSLLAIGALIFADLRGLSHLYPGFDPKNLVVMNAFAPGSKYKTDENRSRYQTRLLKEIQSIPGIESAGFIQMMPFLHVGNNTVMNVEGRPTYDVAHSVSIELRFISPSYFQAMKIPLLQGRFFTENDKVADVMPIIINQTLRKLYWPQGDPLGAFVKMLSWDTKRFQVVGVVGDVRNNGLANPTLPEFYLSYRCVPPQEMSWAIRSPLSPEALTPALRKAVQRVDPEQPIFDVRTMPEILSHSVSDRRLQMLMVNFFALSALLLAILGIYGVVSYTVRQRVREMGTRMAVGATPRDLLKLVLASGLKMSATGIAIGLVLVWTFTRSKLIATNLTDVFPALLLAAVLITACTLFACWFPAWRTTTLPPMVAIRGDLHLSWASFRQNYRILTERVSEFVLPSHEPPAGVSGTEMLAAIADASRNAESFTEAIEAALLTLREQVKASGAFLLTRLDQDHPFLTEGFALPANSLLLNRLRNYSSALPLTRADLAGWRKWAQEQAPEHLPELTTLEQMDTALAAPLQSKSGITGILILSAPLDRNSYSGAERTVVRSAAAEFALLLENSRLSARIVDQERLRRELALATEVQKRLFPESPFRTAGLQLTGICMPARGVGGDYYDFLDLGNQQIGIALADVAGKGIAAALIMSIVQASLRSLASTDGISLADLAAKMNRLLHRSTGVNGYATFFYSQFDEKRCTLRYVNAGHNPPFLLRQNGQLEELKNGGMIIGMFAQAAYEETEIQLQSGDVLLAFSDGVTEAHNPQQEEFDEEPLKDLLRRAAALPIQDMAEKILDELKVWMADAPQHDDLTFILMRVA